MSANKTIITSSAAPPAIGPYSHAVRAEGPLVFVSGCVGFAPETFTGKELYDSTFVDLNCRRF